MKFIELFAGIGGFRRGLEQVDKDVDSKDFLLPGQQLLERDNDTTILQKEKKATYTCVWANEIDKYACQIYRRNYGEGELYEGDITKVNTDDIPDHDLLVGGFPCQAFSIAGKRLGFDDTRGTLFFEIARILKAKRPKYCLLENVKGLLSHDNGRTFKTILSSLDELGYDLQWQVLNSKNFGVPQNRERVFIIGHLRGTSRPEVFPITGCSKQDSGIIKRVNTGHDGNTIYGIEGLSVTQKALGGGQGGKGGIYDVGNMKVRRLTPTECERLQGFPDGWTEGVSDTQRYKCLGNAVTANVITEIGKNLVRT